jgi:hypothetical protein
MNWVENGGSHKFGVEIEIFVLFKPPVPPRKKKT